jgi:putative ABC transport system permease protein
VVDTKNRVDYTVLKSLGFDTEGIESIPFDHIVGTQIKIISNDDYYIGTPRERFSRGAAMKPCTTLKTAFHYPVGHRPAKTRQLLRGACAGLAYSDGLSQWVLRNAADSGIVKAQRESGRSVITMEELGRRRKTKGDRLSRRDPRPYLILVYRRILTTRTPSCPIWTHTTGGGPPPNRSFIPTLPEP